MSADNGIYILQTYGPEWRVAHQQNIEEIYGNFSDDTYKWEGDPEEMFRYFGEAPVFLSLEEALDFAEEMVYDYDYLEYGICVISDFKEMDFNNLRKSYGTEAKSGTR